MRILTTAKLVFCLFLPCLTLADEVYFSPHGHVREQIIQRIHHTKVTLDIAMYSLTSREIAEALADAHRRGVRVRIVRDISQTREKSDEDSYLESQSVDFRLLKGLGRGIMHDKFAIFDEKEGFTGSYNWTQNAELDNYENAFFFSDPQIVQAYQKEFDRLWDAATPAPGGHAESRSSLFHGYQALSIFGLFIILLAVAAALTT